ncbi:SSF family Na(+)/solute symporter [Idiomarina xiamenensis 10-D-4]|uniref:SSF family Na(+)/solute symporter n=1 Tax=Idiomarina xiamenensis 10-D-4 TaxID=740709 RepID=K2K676_9GAMM|nr:SSF family Na(+)/solute symporter [Idiomarina xiamenensis 10-D-4]
MDIQTLTFIIVGLTFALYIGIAIWSRAGSTNDFYVASGGVHPVMNGMATAVGGVVHFDGRYYRFRWLRW